MDAALNAVETFLDAGGQWLYDMNPSIPRVYTPVASSFDASWYSPAREVFEDMLIAAALFPALLVYSFSLSWHVALPEKHDPGTAAYAVIRRWWRGDAGGTASPWRGTLFQTLLRWADVIQQASLVCLYGMTWVYKLAVPGRVPFVLMPCHIHAAALVYLILADPTTRRNKRIAYVTLCLNWGTWLAMAAPDTRDLTMVGEAFHFWAYHILLLTLPVTWILRRRYPLYSGWGGLCSTWATFCLIAIYPVQLISVVLSRNITYMMIPPKPLMAAAGTKYRKFFGLIAVPLLAAFIRFVFTEAIVAAAGLHAQAAAEAEEGGATELCLPSSGKAHDQGSVGNGYATSSEESAPPSSRGRSRSGSAPTSRAGRGASTKATPVPVGQRGSVLATGPAPTTLHSPTSTSPTGAAAVRRRR